MDFRVLHSPDVKHYKQVDAAVAKGRSASFPIRRICSYLAPDFFLTVNTVLVRPVLEYCLDPTTA